MSARPTIPGTAPAAGVPVPGTAISALAATVVTVCFLFGRVRSGPLAYRLAPRPRRTRMLAIGAEALATAGGHILGTFLAVTVSIGGALMGSIRALVAMPAAAGPRLRLREVTVGRLDTS